jgi:hypothetical protein
MWSMKSPSMKRTDSTDRNRFRSGAPQGWPDRFFFRLSARTPLLFLAILLLVGFASLLSPRARTDWSNPSGFALNNGLFSPNLNNTSAKVPALFPGVAPDSEFDVDDADEITWFVVPALHSTRKDETAGTMLGDFLSFNQHRGDTPMIRSWRSLGLQALLAAALSAGPALAQADATKTDAQKTDAQKIDDIQKVATELQKTLLGLQKSIDGLKADLGNLRTESQLNVQSAEKKANDLKDEIAKVKLDVEQLGARTPQRIAAFAPAEPVAATGRVEMVNTFPESVTIVVNRLTYTLVPGDKRLSEPVPAGTFTYEVLGITPPRTRTIGANQVFTVSVYPQS